MILLQNKLRGNSELYPTEELKIIYASGRVGGDAFTPIARRLVTTSQYAYCTIKDFYTHMTELYGDPNKERNARRDFKELSMLKTQTFQEFYTLFLCHVADGDINPQGLKDELNDKLTWKLQEMVSTYYNDDSIDLTTFARHCTT